MGEMEVSLEDPKYPVGGTTKMGTKVNPQMEACTGIPCYDGAPVEVGPRARLVKFSNFNEKGTDWPAGCPPAGIPLLTDFNYLGT